MLCAELDGLHPTDTELGRLSVVGGGSIYPTAQNFCLALRAQGVASALTTLLVHYEPQVKELLGIPDGVITAAHIAVGYPDRGFPTRLTRTPSRRSSSTRRTAPRSPPADRHAPTRARRSGDGGEADVRRAPEVNPALAATVRAYTRDVLDRLRAQGTPTDMLQLGNEIRNGMLWPGRAERLVRGHRLGRPRNPPARGGRRGARRRRLRRPASV